MIRRLVNFTISKIKRKEFELDKNIPISYIIRLCLNKTVCLINGMLTFRSIKPQFLHWSSSIKCTSKIKLGKNCTIDRGCYIDALSTSGLIMGNNVSAGKYTCIECTGSLKHIGKGIVIGDGVGLGTHGYYGGAGGLTIGSNTIFGNYVSIHPENHNYTDLTCAIKDQGVNSIGIIIGKDCWIGSKVTILDGSKIGNHCVVAAGAVVKGNFPDNTVIGGVPAKILKHLN